MTEQEALTLLEQMSENEYGEFWRKLPYRVQLTCYGLCDWREILTYWYIKLIEEG